MSSTAVAIADAVVADLVAAQSPETDFFRPGVFSLAFTPVRAWRPRYSLADFAVLKVTVRPSAFTLERLSRHDTQSDFGIDLAIQQAVAGQADPLLDTLAGLAEEIARYWLNRRIETPACVCLHAGLAPESARFFIPEQLDAENLFTGVVSLTFRQFGGT